MIMATDLETDDRYDESSSEFEPWYVIELESRCGVCTETITQETPVTVCTTPFSCAIHEVALPD